MPDDKEKQQGKLVDIDTSGPGAEVSIPEEKKQEAEPEVEVKDEKITEDTVKSDDAPAESDKQPDVQESKPQDAKLDSVYLKDSEERIKSQLNAVKGKLASAIESGDTAKQVEAQTELSTLTSDAKGVESEKLRRQTYEKEPRTPAYGGGTPEKTPTLPQVDEKAEDWATKNNWFGQNRAMTFTAFEIHKDLVEKEGFDPKSDEYYAEIDKRIKVDFPHKFDRKEGTAKTVQTVASVKRGVKPGRKSVKLTSSQVQIARKLNVPLEEYAKQLLNVKEV